MSSHLHRLISPRASRLAFLITFGSRAANLSPQSAAVCGLVASLTPPLPFSGSVSFLGNLNGNHKERDANADAMTEW